MFAGPLSPPHQRFFISPIVPSRSYTPPPPPPPLLSQFLLLLSFQSGVLVHSFIISVVCCTYSLLLFFFLFITTTAIITIISSNVITITICTLTTISTHHHQQHYCHQLLLSPSPPSQYQPATTTKATADTYLPDERNMSAVDVRLKQWRLHAALTSMHTILSVGYTSTSHTIQFCLPSLIFLSSVSVTLCLVTHSFTTFRLYIFSVSSSLSPFFIRLYTIFFLILSSPYHSSSFIHSRLATHSFAVLHYNFYLLQLTTLNQLK